MASNRVKNSAVFFQKQILKDPLLLFADERADDLVEVAAKHRQHVICVSVKEPINELIEK